MSRREIELTGWLILLARFFSGKLVDLLRESSIEDKFRVNDGSAQIEPQAKAFTPIAITLTQNPLRSSTYG